MQFNFKRTLIIAYVVVGFVWAILNLPNLMARSKGNSILATGLSVGRILLWPIFVLLTMKGKYANKNLSEGESDDAALSD